MDSEGIERVDVNENGGKTPWVDVLAGSAPFLLWGSVLIASEIPHDWLVGGLIARTSLAIVGLLIILPVGVGIGWVLGFPRWSYSYVPASVLFAAYLANASTPGLQFFGYPTFDRELWGWRAWVPLCFALLVALLVSRSAQPAVRLFTNLHRDPTLIAYGLFGLMPLAVLAFFDEMDRLYSLYFMIAFALASTVASGLYVRLPRTKVGLSALLTGIVVAILILVLGPSIYWQSHGGMNLAPSIVVGRVLFASMAAPVLFVLFGASGRRAAV